MIYLINNIKYLMYKEAYLSKRVINRALYKVVISPIAYCLGLEGLGRLRSRPHAQIGPAGRRPPPRWGLGRKGVSAEIATRARAPQGNRGAI